MFDLVTYWKDFPPVHVSIAGIIKGFGSADENTAPASTTHDDVAAFVDVFKRTK